MPTISIITPNFNHGHYLPACVATAQEQSFGDFEILIVDDASTDDSWEVMQAMAREEPRIRLFRNDRNRRVEYSINRALGEARGKYVVFRSADDFHLSGFFDEAVAALDNEPRAAFCFGELEFCDEAGTVLDSTRHRLLPGAGYLEPKRLAWKMAGEPFPTPSMLVRRERVQEMGGFPVEMKWHADWYAASVLGYRHGACYAPMPFARMRRREDSYLASGLQAGDEEIAILKTILDRVRREDADVLGYWMLGGVLRNFYLTASRVARSGGLQSDVVERLLFHRIHHMNIELNRFRPAVSALWPTEARWSES